MLIPLMGYGQNYKKIIFNKEDSASDYYLAIPPSHPKDIKAVVVLFCSFKNPEDLLPETSIQNVAFTNNILTVIANLGTKLYLDAATIDRMNAIVENISNKFSVNTSKFALGAFDWAGLVLLRYAELTHQYPDKFPVQPKAVFTIGSPVDLFGVWRWCEGQIKKDYYMGSVNDAKFVLKTLKKEIGSALMIILNDIKN